MIVTAQRRTENLQDVPLAIQALTGDTLSQLNVTTIDEFIKYLPSVSTATLGPGQSNIYMRGLSVGALGTQGSGTNGTWPNVAVYLDEQSTQIPGRNLDVYAADLERIEVLTGPQGTLFGAGAQAGVLRYITNKPQINEWSSNVKAGYATTADGDEQLQRRGRDQHPADRRQARGARRGLPGPSRRLHRQRLQHLHAQRHGPRLRTAHGRRRSDRFRGHRQLDISSRTTSTRSTTRASARA